MNPVGKIVAVSVSSERGVPKRKVASARLVAHFGIEGDAHAGKEGDRQVSLLAVESIEKMRSKGLEVGPGSFAENITTEGLDLMSLEVRTRIEVGEAELEVTRIGKECRDRCSIYYQAGDCVMPREGIFATVIRGGTVRPGDRVKVLSSVPNSRST